jgi:putative NADH-flavin reductase
MHPSSTVGLRRRQTGAIGARWWVGLAALAVLAAGSAALLKPPAKARGINAANSSAAPLLAVSATPQHLLVIGGTSGIGLEVVKLALARGHAVTVMARHAPRQLLAGERYVAGDIQDASAVATAMSGQSAVVTTISMAPSRHATTLFSSGMANVLASMQHEGVVRLVAVTGIGAGESRGHGGFGYDRVFMPLMMRAMYEDKSREETLIRGSALDWTIVRPGFLHGGAGLGHYHVVQQLGGVTSGAIARADVAAFIVAALENGLELRTAVLLTD